jgi:hypothetical protein
MLESWCLFGDNERMKIFLLESLHSVVWGSNPQDFTEQAQSRKTVQLEGDKIVIIYLKWNAQGKGDLDRVSFLPVA